MKTKVYSVTEFGCIYSENSNLVTEESLRQLIMPDDDFNALCNYINTQLTDETVEGKIFRIFYKKGKRVIKAQKQVGVIQFTNGLQIEVLPKIVVQPGENERDFLRRLLLKLLSHVKDYKYLLAGEAQLSSKKDYPILEVFISSYIRELNKICLNGLKNSYEQVRDNINVLKGKLLIQENIKKNKFSQNKFYCQFQQYSPNNPVNRIIKATLEKLLDTSRTFQNRDKIYRLLDVFSQVESNKKWQTDLEKTVYLDRTYKEYDKILMWSRVFLNNSSVTNTQGSIVSTSIMFPMEKVFEDYIAFLFKKYSQDYIITAQDRSIFLVTHRNRGKFRLRPDIVVADDNAPVLIVDTKWKVLNSYEGKDNYGISQSDMYQLYAYGKKYEIEHNKKHENKIKPPHLVLLYPENENFKKKLDNFVYEGDLELDVIPFSFEENKEEEQIRNILNIITIKSSESSIDNISKENKLKILSNDDYRGLSDISYYIPLYTLRAACGYFIDSEEPQVEGWIDASGHGFTPNKDHHFVVHAKGDSMLNKIKDGDLCVFEWYNGGSREGEIVLTQCSETDEAYSGKYTIKKYHSEKIEEDGSWHHTKVELLPLNANYPSIELNPEEEYKTIGIFKCIL